MGTVIGIDLGTTYSCVGVSTNGNRITPSWVGFTNSERLIGEAAKNQAPQNPERTIFDVKRLIGRRFEDSDVQKDMKHLPYKVVNKNGKPSVEVKIKDGEMKSFTYQPTSTTHRDRPPRTIAGLNVVRIINEPTTAAIAYGLDEKSEKNILVILTIDNGVFEVLSTSGDTHLGGEDFDHRVMEHFIKLIKRKYRKDISKDIKALGKLRRECERAKRGLSSQHQVRVEIESLFDGVDFSEPLSRAKFEELNMDLFRKTLRPVKKALEDAKLTKGEIDEIVLVGGSTRIPKVRELLKEMFDGKEPSQSVNPDEAVAHGAAIQGGMLGGHSGNSRIDALLIDVTPLTLGIETVGGVMTPLIPRNTAIPTKKSKVFSTYQDQQTTVSIKVYQGERALTKDCIELGEFDLSGIPPAKRGVPQIEVTFEVDVNGILSVKAEDKAAKKSKSLTITNNKGSTMSKEEIEMKVREGQEMAEEDARVRERIEARNKLESYVYSMKSTIDDGGVKIDSDDKERMESVLKDAMEWLDDNNLLNGSAEKEDYDEKLKEAEAAAAG
ncbi:Heat shock 70 kDa protein BIP1 [Linum perenne]